MNETPLHPSNQPTLCQADCEAIDALVDTGFDPVRVPPPHDRRSRRAAQWLSLLARGWSDRADTAAHPDPAAAQDSRASLITRTLARIENHEAHGKHAATRRASILRSARASAASIDPNLEPALSFRRGPSFNIANLAAAAASFLILTSLMAPMLAGSRAEARKQACRSAMMDAAIGFTTYAGDYIGALPIASASLPAGNWLPLNDFPGPTSRNLFLLAATGHVPLSALACPENACAGVDRRVLDQGGWTSRREVSFSFQNLFTTHRPGWNSPGAIIVILADRNPVLDEFLAGQSIPCSSQSRSHDARGQNALATDGSASWLVSCLFGNDDNIWLPRGMSGSNISLRGDESPVDAADSMVTH